MSDLRVGRFVLDEKQPFGEVHQHMPHPGQGRPAEHMNRPLGPETQVPNNGYDHPVSMADKNPGAHEQACARRSQPFYWSGIPKRKA
jgi:hypothetical protein